MLELALLAVLTTSPPPVAVPVAPVAMPVELGSEPTSTAGGYDYSFATAHNTDVGGGMTKVTALSQFPTPNYGYFPLVVHIDNSLGPRQTIKLAFNTTGQGGQRTFSRSVDVAAGERRAVTIPVPSHMRYGNLRARGPGITEAGDTHLYFNPVNNRQRAVLNLGTAETFQEATNSKPSFSGNANVQVVSLTAAEAPGELAAYVGWDSVVLSAVKLEDLNDAQRRALEGYAALGGHLVLMQGSRGVAAALPLLADDRPHYGIGEVTFCEPCSIAAVLDHSAKVPVRAIEPKGRRNRYAYDDEGVPELALPVAVAPIGRFLLIIAAFTLAIGPGSLWVARKKGPAALLVTIPGTAALTCLLIVGYSLLRDGFTVHATVQGFTLLDSKNHRAITSSVGAFYANLAPGGARFAADTVVVAPTVTREYGSVEQAASINWDDGARFSADFIPSRSYLEWSFLQVAPTRARLVVKEVNGELRVQNALGGELDYLQLRHGRSLYTVTSLKDGSEAVAKKDDKTNAPAIGLMEKRLSEDARQVLTLPLVDGDFIAALKGPGFTPMGGMGLEQTDSRSLVRGGYER